MNERKDFEKWTRDFYGDLACASDTWSEEKGTYNDLAHHMAWCLWRDMQSRLESLEKDAARYRWLKADGEDVDVVRARSDIFNFEWGDELDAAIDAAMKG